MSDNTPGDFGPGVYLVAGDGGKTLVHLHQGGPYRLTDIHELWQLGRVEGGARPGESALVLAAADVPRLKTLADAFSFDFNEEFIEMCHAMHRFAASRPDESFHFVANF